jgi:hypothetical protein
MGTHDRIGLKPCPMDSYTLKMVGKNSCGQHTHVQRGSRQDVSLRRLIQLKSINNPVG